MTFYRKPQGERCEAYGSGEGGKVDGGGEWGLGGGMGKNSVKLADSKAPTRCRFVLLLSVGKKAKNFAQILLTS